LTDVTVSLSPSKAKELKVSTGDVILVVGRRRRATYAFVAVEKAKKEICTLPENMAKNLRLRNGDKLKVIPLGEQEDESRHGDMILLKNATPPKVASVTFSPIEDSLNALSAREGDDLSDDEIMERFVTPYLNLNEATALVKKNSVVAIADDNGKKLEFVVTHVELEDASAMPEQDGTF
jgi:translation initiation factor IF-1